MEGDNFSIFIHSEGLNNIISLKDKVKVEIDLSKKVVIFSSGNEKLYCRENEKIYPDINRVIWDGVYSEISLSKDELIKELRLIKNLLGDKTVITLTTKDDIIELSYDNNSDIYGTVNLTGNSMKNIQLKLNTGYLLDWITVQQNNEVKIKIKENDKPIQIQDENTLYLLMPVISNY
jgi:DNA polymerase III sliding clamp (beta) subunit (PCNA family)